MKYRIITFALLTMSFLFLVKFSDAQGGNANFFEPTVFPSAPNTASFAKFGSYPVNMYSGVPDISIPLYTIESGGLKVPITLAYHASGIRVADAASWVGLGWALNCGGSITRKVFGIPDDNGYLIETKRSLDDLDLQNNNDLDYVRETVEDHQHDNMPDIYSYQIPGYSGKFFYDADSSFKIMMVPRSALSVVGTHGYLAASTDCNCYNQKFTITDEHGNNYGLGNTFQEMTYGNFYSQKSTSAWMLENMISQNKRDTISFNYTQNIYQLPDGMNETITVEDELQIINQYGSGYNVSTSTTPQLLNNPATVTEQQLSTIFFKNGRVDFILDTGKRTDIAAHALDTIKISLYNFSTKKYEVQKSIVFVKSYFGAGLGGIDFLRLRLDKVQILDKAGSIVNEYSFTYNNAVNLPRYGSLARDYWGYYNGKDASTDLIPQTTIQMINPAGGLYNLNIGNPTDPNCRNIDTTKMQADMLTSITFPTGGHSDFVYETNRYIDNDHVLQFAGGLRIHTISSYDSLGSTIPIVRTYQYDVAQPNFFLSPNSTNYGLFVNSQSYRDWVSEAGDDAPIGGYVWAATKRVRRYYAQPNEDLDLDGVPVSYTQVTEYTGTPAANIGKSTSFFSWRAGGLQGGGGETGLPLIYDYSFMNGLLLGKTDYLHKPDGSYQVVKSTSNSYGAWPGFYYDGVGVAMGQRWYNDGALSGNSAYYQQEMPDDEMTYPLGDFAIEDGDINLTSTTTIVYDQNDTTRFTTSSVDYRYDNLRHQQVTRTYHTDSKGNTIVSVNKYPADYPVGNPVIDSMVSRNMKAETIEKWDTLKNLAASVNAVTSAQLTTFKFGNLTGSVVPAKISTLKVGQPLTDFTPSNVVSGTLTSDTRYVQRISFDQYDGQNNINQYTPRNATPTAVLWDYQSEVPVAQVKNATTSTSTTQVAYTSFEADGKGNWTYTGTPLYNNSAPTGTMVYALSSGTITSPTLPSGTAYVLSYWSNGAAASVSNGTSLTGTPVTSANGWTQYEYQVPSGSTQITISGTMTIDELRLYPAAAQMTTYAYDPSGVRSVTDIKGMNNYYDYDYAQRLVDNRDYLGNIVNHYSYHYYDQNIGNDAQTPVIFRNNCPSNNTPGSLTYAVPANKYYSSTKASANADAAYDAATNGQMQANANCSCTPNVTVTLTNSTGQAYEVNFSGHGNPSQTFTFNSTGSTTVQVATGTYDVIIFPDGSGSNHNFELTGQTTVTGSPRASFNSVTVSSSPAITISIF